MHPYDDKKRVNVIPSRVQDLLTLIWDGSAGIVQELKSFETVREFVIQQLKGMRPDHVRPLNPTPYKVSVSQLLHTDMKQLWEDSSPAMELA